MNDPGDIVAAAPRSIPRRRSITLIDPTTRAI
jgi:hypothetical protein